MTPLAQADRASSSSLFCHNGRKLVELETFFAVYVVARVQGPSCSDTKSCVSSDYTRITALLFCDGALILARLCSFPVSSICPHGHFDGQITGATHNNICKSSHLPPRLLLSCPCSHPNSCSTNKRGHRGTFFFNFQIFHFHG